MAWAAECEGLRHRFGNVVAVDGLTLSVAEGEFFAFLGPNGAGKTTTLHIISTLLRPSEGRVRVFGFDAVSEAAAVRRLIGVVFQEPALDDRLTAWENLAIHAALYGIPRAQTRRRIVEALQWARLSHAAKRLVRTFSSGMKRRLELARALMHGPRLLVLDEPTSGLDVQGRRQLWDRVRELQAQGLTVLLATHALDEAETADRVAIVDHGRLVALGNPTELKQRVVGAPDCTLEDVFLALTGRHLRDEPASPRDALLGFARRGGEHTR